VLRKLPTSVFGLPTKKRKYTAEKTSDFGLQSSSNKHKAEKT